MYLSNPEALKKILLKLVECPSLSGTEKEREMAEIIHKILLEIPYFTRNPEHLELIEIENDKYNRCFVSALLKGKGRNTVILLHHHDVVGVDDYGSLKEDAFYPDKITAKLQKLDIPEKARKDLDSGEWQFGRGVMDMKAGAALQIALLHDFSEEECLEGNVLLLSVPGEESNSEGMLAAVPYLNILQEKYDLDYVAVVNSEPHDTDEQGHNDITIGSIGKIMPVFYCFGKETHASAPFEGFNSALLFSQVEAEMENNIELCDRFEDEISPPPVNLKNKDLKELYNVTTPQVTVGYFNVFMMQRTISDISRILKVIASKAFNNALKLQKEKAERFADLSGKKHEVPWKTNVYMFEELYEKAYKAHGKEFKNHLDEYIKDLQTTEEDEREFTIKLIDAVHNFCPDREPKIVIAFAPPYYPHIRNKGETDKEKYLLKVIDRIKEYGRDNFNIEFRVTKMHEGITDLSYCGLQDPMILTYLKPNMPALGHIYDIPIEDLQTLNTAVINIGPLGRDAHKFTERLYMPYFEEILPSLLRYTVYQLLKF